MKERESGLYIGFQKEACDYINEIRAWYKKNEPKIEDQDFDDKTSDLLGVCDGVFSGNSNKEELLEYINEHTDFLIEEGIISDVSKETFRKVYEFVSMPTVSDDGTDVDWQLFAVKEIGEDNDKLDKNSIFWCDLLIDYILVNVGIVKDICLFLHDKDVVGFSDKMTRLVEGTEQCYNEGLISKEVKERLNGKTLKIVFFKHVDSCVLDVIGKSELEMKDRLASLKSDFMEVFKHLSGINELISMAAKRKEDIEKYI